MLRGVLIAVGCSLLTGAGAFAPPAGAPLRASGKQGLALGGSCAGRGSRLAGPLSLRASVEDLLSPFGDGGKKVGKAIDWFFDTSEVAGAKAWRLQQIPGEADATKWRTSGDDLEELMQDQISSKRQKAGAARADRAKELGLDLDDAAFTDAQEYSMTDEDLEDALSKRLAEISSGKVEPTTGAADEGLTGMELAEMCVKKYGVAYDMSIKCDKFQLVSDQKLVSLNLYYAFYGQLNPPFPYNEEQYIGRLSYMASMINQWGQAQYVRDFFKEPPTAKRGLPSRPRWDTAVSIRLSSSPTWRPELVDDFFVQ